MWIIFCWSHIYTFCKLGSISFNQLYLKIIIPWKGIIFVLIVYFTEISKGLYSCPVDCVSLREVWSLLLIQSAKCVPWSVNYLYVMQASIINILVFSNAPNFHITSFSKDALDMLFIIQFFLLFHLGKMLTLNNVFTVDICKDENEHLFGKNCFPNLLSFLFQFYKIMNSQWISF